MIAHLPLVLLTGASGNIGSGFRDDYIARYSHQYRLRLTSHGDDLDDARFSDIVNVDIEDLGALTEACRGVSTVVHLAANADWQADFCDELVGPNIIGAYHVFEAARRAGCARVVFASSVHAVMGYPLDHQARTTDAARPDTLYGVTKVFGEALCSSYAYTHGLSCIAIRIGAYVPDSELDSVHECANPQLLDIFISQRDMSEILHRAIVAPRDLRYAIVHAVSDNRFKRLDMTATEELLGVRVRDDAFAISDHVRLGPEVKV